VALGQIDPRGVAERGGEVEDRHQTLHATAAVEARASEHRRYAQRRVVPRALVLVVARLEVVAVIRGDEHDGVVARHRKTQPSRSTPN